MTIQSLVRLLLLVTMYSWGCSTTGVLAQEPASGPAPSVARKLMTKHFGKLNEQLDGRLSGLMQGLDGVGTVQRYFRYVIQDDHGAEARKDYEAFQKMFVACLKRVSTPDGVEYGILSDMWARIAGPYIVLDTIGPHVGENGELAGLLNSPSDVVRFVDGRLAPHRSLSFQPFIAYLRPNAPGTAHGANAELLMDYMLRTEPVLALEALLQLEYGMTESKGRIGWPFYGEDVPEAKRQELQQNAEKGAELYRLNVMVRAVRDLDRVNTELPQGLRDRVRKLLVARADDDAWWLREYVATVLATTNSVSDRAVLERLKSDSNKLVRRAASAE